MKALVIYYSLDGNTAFIADTIAAAIGADTLRLKPINDIKSKGVMKLFWGGKQALSKKMPDLEPMDKKPEDYEVLFIGTPVWAWTYAPALKTFFQAVNVSGKKIALFCSSGGGPGKTIQKMQDALPGNEFLPTQQFVEPLRKPDANAATTRTWVQAVMDQLSPNPDSD